MTATIRLLYAEDSPSDSDLTRTYFETEAPDFQLEVVETGQACLTRLEHAHYDVLLLDHHLPDMDSVDVLNALAKQEVSLPVVVATSVGDEDLVVHVLRLGAWDYVPKDGEYIQNLPTILRNAVAEYRKRGNQGHAGRRRQRRILYVECHAADIDLTVKHFAENASHLSVEIVRSSTEALALLQDIRFDLVLTDLRMPDLNALDLLRELRQRDLSVPVVVVTGKGDEMAAVASLKLGAYDYIVKRHDYLTQLPYVVDNAIDRFHLASVSERLKAELAERERAEAERTHLAVQLRQAQRIDALGRLAGGVAHDFNNLLTVILGRVDLMLQDLPDVDPMRESVSEIKATATRAAELTRQLLAFGRRQLLHPRVLDVNVLLLESVKVLRLVLGEDVELVTILDPNLGRVKADPVQLDQVFLNLAVNARDAMPHGGRLTIETRNVTIEDGDAQQHASFQPDSYVLVAISDSGVGIDAEDLPHIFEPFFTTKKRGKGTGLGLSTVYGIMKQSGGWIWVDSDRDRGTTFKICLPRVNEPFTEAKTPVEIESPRGSETVLVVEDEESVRKLTCNVLRKYGYHVVEATNAFEALLTCERRVLPIQLLITDVIMPQISGPELAARARQLNPEIRILFLSGYIAAADIRQGLLDQSLAFLEKPFTPSELARKVREVLDHPAAAAS